MNRRLADLPSALALDAMEKMLVHMQEIVSDPDFLALRARLAAGEEMTAMEAARAAFPLIASRHRAALYGIVAAVTGQTVEEIDRQPLSATIACFEGALGAEVIGFFTYCARMAARL